MGAEVAKDAVSPTHGARYWLLNHGARYWLLTSGAHYWLFIAPQKRRANRLIGRWEAWTPEHTDHNVFYPSVCALNHILHKDITSKGRQDCSQHKKKQKLDEFHPCFKQHFTENKTVQSEWAKYQGRVDFWGCPVLSGSPGPYKSSF